MRTIKTLKIKENLYWTGILDYDLRVFDIIMYTEFGTTYNSYVIKGSEKTALIETAKANYRDDYIDKLKEIVDLKDIEYIILNHTEPDHSGSIEKMLEIIPDVKIVGTVGAIGFLKQIANRDFNSITVKENDVISLGDKTLQFMPLPNLHWPDTMFTYVKEDKALFTCDAFGAHYSHEGVLRSNVPSEEDYMKAAKYYFEHIIGPFKKPYMTNALKRIENLEIDMICTGHGPVLDSHVDEIISLYKDWCNCDNNSKPTVVIPYVSAYGYTKQLAEYISKGVSESGDIVVHSYDMVETDLNEVVKEINNCDGLLLGTPTIVGEALKPIWDITTSLYPVMCAGKLASAFGSYGWSGEGVPHISERLKQLKFKVLDGFRIRFKPSESELNDAYNFGYNFGLALTDKDKN